MVGLDTNILVRYLTGDDRIQSAQAANLVERQLTAENPGYVSLVVIAETAWVLASAYGLPDAAIAEALRGLLRTGAFRVKAKPKFMPPWQFCRAGRAVSPTR